MFVGHRPISSHRMKTFTVSEAKNQLAQLVAEAHDGKLIILTDGDKQVWLDASRPLDLEEDTPELEAELLKAADGPFAPYSAEEMRGVVERIIREEAGAETNPADLVTVK